MKSRIVLIVLALAATLVAAVPGTARAGNNGQQVKLCPYNPRYSYGTATILGYNQNGAYVMSPAVRLGDAGNGGNFSTAGCVLLSGWWWKGDVYITWSNGTVSERTICNVPTWNPFNDERRCDG
jgi:hypothetical protein